MMYGCGRKQKDLRYDNINEKVIGHSGDNLSCISSQHDKSDINKVIRLTNVNTVIGGGVYV